MGTLIVGAILVLIVGLIIKGIVRDKKSGKSSCGGDCSNCKGCH
ncbi:MAG: FeoB-associated Cys-rich membrane protein [Blautia wexlerae]